MSSPVEIVQRLVQCYMDGNAEGYLAGCTEDFKGDVLAGIVPGGENITSLDAFKAMMPEMAKVMDVKKFQPANWVGVGNNVFFTVDWEFVYLPTGKTVTTTATVRKVIRDGKICEKYHRVNADAIKQALEPAAAAVEPKEADCDAAKNIALVQGLVGEYMAGRAEGYLAGCHDEFKGDVLAGLVPGGENITSLDAFKAMMPEMPKVMDVKKFQPANWAGVGNNVFFTVDWEFVHVPTGKTVTTTATVRKLIRDGKICEKYHRVNAEAIKQAVMPAHRVTVCPIVPGSLKEIVAAFDTAEFKQMIAGKGIVSVEAVELAEDKMLVRSVWESVEAQKEADALVAQVIGSVLKPYIAGKPDAKQGAQVWTYKGPGDASQTCYSRATVIPLQPHALGKTLAVVNDASFLEALAALSPEFVGVDVFHTSDDVLVTYSHWTSREAEQATAPKMGALFKPMAPNFAGPPTPMPGPIVWRHDADTTFTAFTPSPAPVEPLPVLLFQSGYGSSSAGHQPLLQKVADAGFVVVVPDRKGDTAGGKASVGALFSEGKVVSALSTDGTHLAAALAWVKAQSEVGGCKVDTSKVAAGGFSMGAIEAIRFADACAEVKAVAVISSSTSAMAEPLYNFKEADLLGTVSQWAATPSLWISSDKDLQLAATRALYESAAAPAAFVNFKDEVLDNSMALTDATSIWSPEVDAMAPGLKQHFALAAEAGVVSDAPIVAFLQQHLLGAPAAPLAADGTTAELLLKSKPSRSSKPERFGSAANEASEQRRASLFRKLFRRRSSSAGAPASPAA